jgi:dTDP-4-dehydrorhamnose 3,5-epimerase
MQVQTISIDGPFIIKPSIFSDSRGYFYESYNEFNYKNSGIQFNFVQDNQSCSQKGTIRGLHFQAPPFDQGKLVRVIKGAVVDVVVDIRKNSPTYGKHFSVELNEDNHLQFWIPPGFAHGFETLADNTIFLYKCTNVYNKASEGGLLWNDPELGIQWQTKQALVSEKDELLPLFKNFNSPF